ncbi:Fe3+/spermidine/putrescine ABC transporter ATP-binding protein [Labrys okinawensis]|uniref:Fe3+/spermidine/putrescine ABC transporter ATP-binding protein n=1 Tax=Labrys okinawensis TaxID=346911 RepID=A0A2S9QAA8_9HYPH|nr:ABC transporter ATP-binding protein [Labrys okinawensis]PRH86279.1 Fe3+/spermidine/putrescine ABC transporter ATP-binding protein [Labrys okinawensis]
MKPSDQFLAGAPSAPVRQPLLEVDRASVRLGNTQVFEDLSLTVGEGEFVALLGSSGCGKTSLLRTIAGFIQPRSGAIRVRGRDITGEPPDRRGMALVFQTYALWPHMTVAQNIGYGLKLRRLARGEIAAKVKDIAALLGLSGLEERKPAALSGGQRQRVALGRALAVSPDILLLDEPLSNLDARIRLSVRQEISALQRRLGITAIHVTHDREEAMVMADRIVILNAGRIAQIGTPEEVYNQPASAFVAAFMGAENRLRLTCSPASSEAGLSRLEGAGGAPALIATFGPAASGPCIAHFRAEAAELQATAPLAEPTRGFLALAGEIVQVSFPGGFWRHVVATPAGPLVVDAPRAWAAGAKVNVHIPETGLFVFPASQAES